MKSDNMKSNIHSVSAQPMYPSTCTAVDQTTLRNALGRFATGVCILSGLGPDRQPFGMTINSFNSVSLDPPRVCWSIDRSTPDLERYLRCDAYCVSVLNRDQAALCLAFAAERSDRFSGTDWATTGAGCPIAPGAIAHFDCSVVQRVDVGDHVLCIAAVEALATADGEPLGFYAGALVDLLPRAVEPGAGDDFSDRYVAALLGRASAVLNGAFARRLPAGLKLVHWRVLACLVDGPLTVNVLAARVVVKQPTLTRTLDLMVERGLVRRSGDSGDRRRVLVAATARGLALGRSLREHALDEEERVFSGWSASERLHFSRLLRRLLDSHAASQKATDTAPEHA